MSSQLHLLSSDDRLDGEFFLLLKNKFFFFTVFLEKQEKAENEKKEKYERESNQVLTSLATLDHDGFNL